MSSDFKELNLDQDRLKDCIEEFWKINNCQNSTYSKVTDSRYRAKYNQDGSLVTVDFIFSNKGTTTIQTQVGKDFEKGEQLASYLKDNLVSDSSKCIYVTVNNITHVTFELLLDFFKELKNEDLDRSEISFSVNSEDLVKKIVRATSRYKDSLTLTHYQTKNTLLIQGKPLYSYRQVSYFLAKYADLNGFLAIASKGEEAPNAINVDENTVETELKALLPNAYSGLGDGILKMLRTSYTLKDISIPLQDYGCYVFPALRGLEGVMRQLLFDKGYSIQIDNNNSFHGIFYKNQSIRRYLVADEFRRKIGDSKICQALEHCYTYFNQQRHELFHANDFPDSSRFIETKEEANQIIEKVITIIDKAYEIANGS